jgi:hypothetical protein
MSWFKLEISEDAYNRIHQHFLAEKAQNDKISKGDVAVKLITEGIVGSITLPKSQAPRREPTGDRKIVQIDKAAHAVFLQKLDAFTGEKNFLSRHFAARHALYQTLGLLPR